MKNLSILLILSAMLIGVGCKQKSPEELPKYKKKFRTQIASFEKVKTETDNKVEDGVSMLTGIKEALETARNVDKEFAAVYTKWEKVSKQVNDLEKEYGALKTDAENLFGAMERQTASLRDPKTRGQLESALRTTRTDYTETLNRTKQSIDDLRKLYDEAQDVIKALEVAVAMGEFQNINESLASIESRVQDIMNQLTETVDESKALYDQKIGKIGS
ncbi:MAG: hypothetical protein MRZ79_09270 [Bacteroidia bacterium]|nr:hypothetical protein [Bacteroidia bacterium]